MNSIRPVTLPVLCLASVIWACAAAPSGAEIVEGEALELTPAAGVAPMRFRVEQCSRRIRSEWHAKDGTLLAWDEVEMLGRDFVRYRLVRPNLGQDVTLTAAGMGTAMSGSNALPVLAGPMLIDFARAHLNELRGGTQLRVRYLIAEHRMFVMLRLRSITAHTPGTTVRIDAAQPWMRPLVPEAMLEFDPAARFTGMRGQILPQAGTRLRPAPIAARLRVLGGAATSQCLPNATT